METTGVQTRSTMKRNLLLLSCPSIKGLDGMFVVKCTTTTDAKLRHLDCERLMRPYLTIISIYKS